MVYKTMGPNQNSVFVSSDVTNRDTAREEINEWAATNGYEESGTARWFRIYSQGMPVRGWTLLTTCIDRDG